MLNNTELKVAMLRYNDKQEDLANALGITPALLSARINNKIEFKRNEIQIILDRYNLSMEDTKRIFFAPDVSNKETELKSN